MNVRLLTVVGFLFTLALPRCTCLPPLLPEFPDAALPDELPPPGDEDIDQGEAPVTGGQSTKAASRLRVSGAAGSMSSPNYKLEVSIGRGGEMPRSTHYQLRAGSVGSGGERR